MFPANWNGLFFGNGNDIDGSFILESTVPIARAVSIFETFENPKYALATACFDLRMNGFNGRADGLITAAGIKWPGFPVEQLRTHESKWFAFRPIRDDFSAFKIQESIETILGIECEHLVMVD